jgi:hypothetical protein
MGGEPMMAPQGKEDVLRRIVVEYGQLYVYVYMTDGNGKVLDEEVFKQPWKLDRKDAYEEAKDTYDTIFDWVNEIVNVTPPLQGEDDDEAESDAED